LGEIAEVSLKPSLMLAASWCGCRRCADGRDVLRSVLTEFLA
jgi:hypothetical protein